MSWSSSSCRRGPSPAIWWLGFLLAGCAEAGSLQTDQCHKDGDCRGDARCLDGACVPAGCTPARCTSPPGDAACYRLPGACAAGACRYVPQVGLPCDDGDPCTGGDQCGQGGSCAGVPQRCEDLSPSSCKDPATLVVQAMPGVCQRGDCAYAAVEVACPEGCADGRCRGNPCAAVRCDAIPPPRCVNADTLRTSLVGSCEEGLCRYPFDDTVCPFGCVGDACQPGPCAGVTCDHPPPDVCADASTWRHYGAAGACAGGQCSYPFADTPCPTGCVGGACLPGACDGVTCNLPPPDICADPATRRHFAPVGTCRDGECSYPQEDTVCVRGCVQGACLSGPCDDVVCDAPPLDVCADPATRRHFDRAGLCRDGECSYAHEDTECPFGCDGGQCQGCNPTWVDNGPCGGCLATACQGCSGTLSQDDGCGGSRSVACELPATGCGGPCCGGTCCAAGEVCAAQSCCRPTCPGQCGDDGCGGSCGACRASEACLAGSCQPLALLQGCEGGIPSLACPVGYTEVGHWYTAPWLPDEQPLGFDHLGNPIYQGWLWLCSADPARVKVIVGYDDCGVRSSPCAGQVRGHWHLSYSCDDPGITGVDVFGMTLTSGWLRLCVEPGSEAFVEVASDDCGQVVPAGCGELGTQGSWRTAPPSCGGGETGVGDGGASIVSGWMVVCAGAP